LKAIIGIEGERQIGENTAQTSKGIET